MYGSCLLRIGRGTQSRVLAGVLLASILLAPSLLEAAEIPFSARKQVTESLSGAVAIHAADMDRDGDLDLVGASQDSNDIVWMENADGTGESWTGHSIHGDFEGTSSVYAADLDGDNDVDILTTGDSAYEIVWYQNVSDPLATGIHWEHWAFYK